MNFDRYIHDSVEAWGWPASAVVRLAVAAACGALVGLEREVRGRQAGFRTNLLVCLGCAIVMVVSLQVGHLDWPAVPGREVQVDPARIAYGVMAGVGFLGAGAIVRHGGDVRGLTTAAAIWCVAGIGLGAGLGLYLFALLSTLMVLAALWVLDGIDRMLPRTHFRSVVLRLAWDPGCVADTVRRVGEAGFKVADWEFCRSADLRTVDITLVIGFRDRRRFDDLGQGLPLATGYELVSVSN